MFLCEDDVAGGGSRAVQLFAQGLAKRGHEIFCVGLTPLLWIASEERMRVITPPFFKTKIRGIGRLNKILRNLWLQTIVRSRLHNFRPDWILGHQWQPSLLVDSWRKNFKSKIGHFIFETSLMLAERPYGKHAEVWSQFEECWTRSDVNLPISIVTAQSLCELGLDNVSVPIFPGVEPSFKIKPLEWKERQDWVIYVGRLHPHKRVDRLIQAFKEVPPNWTLHIAGVGPDESRLKSIAKSFKSRVIFHGFITEQEKWHFLTRSKLFVCPSMQEGFGMPVGESLWAKTPCLASNLEVFRKTYPRGVVFFDPDNISEFQERLLELLQNDKKLRSIYESIGTLEIPYTWSNAAKSLEEVLSRGDIQQKHG